jgi:hypothetical protein
MKRKHKHFCSYCGKEKEKCRIVSVREVDDRPEVEWCCMSCWEKELMDHYMYEHHQRVGDEPV